jgi:hypothetical protein
LTVSSHGHPLASMGGICIKVDIVANCHVILRFAIDMFTKRPLPESRKMELSKTTDIASNTSPVSALMTMFYDPRRAFAMLEPKRHAWLPLVLLILSSTALMLWYFSVVDFSWLMDQIFASIKDASKREQAKGMMSKSMMQTTTVITSLVTYPAISALIGVYFMIVGKSTNKDVSFGAGFALSAWAFVPALLMLPMGAVAIAMASGGQLGFSELNPLSVNQLFFHHDMAHPMTGVLDSINATSLWSVFLMVVGYQVWAKAARATALKVVLIPYFTIYVLWFAFALSKAA